MDNYSKSLFFISLDHYYWVHVTLFALSDAHRRSGMLNNHYWLILIDYIVWLYWYFVSFQCCMRKHWNFPYMFCFLPTKVGNPFQKQAVSEKIHLCSLNNVCVSGKHSWNNAFFSVKRTFVSGKIIHLVSKWNTSWQCAKRAFLLWGGGWRKYTPVWLHKGTGGIWKRRE